MLIGERLTDEHELIILLKEFDDLVKKEGDSDETSFGMLLGHSFAQIRKIMKAEAMRIIKLEEDIALLKEELSKR